MEHSPMMAQLMPKKTKMMIKEKSPLKNWLQQVSSKLLQLMSSGVGTLLFFTRSF